MITFKKKKKKKTKKKPRKNPPEGCCLRKMNIEGKRFNKCAYVRGDRNCSLLLPELMPKLLVLNRDRRQQEYSLDSAPARKIEWNKIKIKNQGSS